MKQKKLVKTQKLTYDKIDKNLKKFAEFCKDLISKIQRFLSENSNQCHSNIKKFEFSHILI